LTPASDPIDEMRVVRCPKCDRFLFRVRGIAEIEIMCPRCSSLVLWPDLSVTVLLVKPTIAITPHYDRHT